MDTVHAYKFVVRQLRRDGTPSGESVRLLCEECFRNEWTFRETGVRDWQLLRDRVIRTELRRDVKIAYVAGRDWQDLAHRGVDYDEALDGFCPHLEAQLGVERGPRGEFRTKKEG